MGSKTPEDYQQTPNANPTVNVSQWGSSSADLDRGIVSDDDDDDANEVVGMSIPLHNAERKKKKRKRTKKKQQVDSARKGVGKAELKQSDPPRVLVSTLFPSQYPSGEFVPYENTSRTIDEETRYNSRLWDPDFLTDYRQAAEIHRQVRRYAQKELIKPGESLLSIAEGIEEGVRALSGHQGLEKGDGFKASMGFPTGLCLNNVAAHWTPNPREKDIFLKESDVLKVDFGVHVNGRIVDSAFTVAFDPTYDNLLTSVEEATNEGITVGSSQNIMT
ncbi:putative Methionine aminopeptidase 2 like protein [Glarea lozoyensis 74030]|uniref:Putative Methionine aminopeptidase 2 like protein n=1 Tax=Glarea lozoyensis (strain ATCC 74030 / MF5533) TaxID=1104152 RepID=H0EHA6_GLAL7|nr:putative Methionine aminopeptidase 2 like protein [Glarea lozoyensis 74030]